MNTGSLWQRLLRGVRRTLYRLDWPAFAGREFDAEIMSVPVTDRYHAKQGRSTGRLVLERGRDRLVIYLKRHRRLSWWQHLLATLWPGPGWSPALAEWRHLQWAQKHGFPVPAPVAAGEFIGPWLRLRSFLAVEELTGMLPLHEAIPLAMQRLPPEVFRSWKTRLIEEIARLARALHQARRYHKDFYLCHLFVPEEDIGRPYSLRGRVFLIDLHRLGHHRWLGWRYRVKDLAQLLYSADIPGIDDRDRLRFFRCYWQADQLGSRGRHLRRAILWKAGRYRRHNAKKSRVVSQVHAFREVAAS